MGKALLAAAVYLLVLALLSRGPLGLVRIVGPRLHQALDFALVIGLAVSPVIARRDLDVAGVIVAEALAIVVLRVALRTSYVKAATPPRTVDASARAGAPVDPSPSVLDRSRSSSSAEGADAPPPGVPNPPATQRPVPTTAWTLGVLAARARRRTTGPDRALDDGARRLGSALGRANRRRTD